MQQQNYRNHRAFYIPHHFIFYPLILVLLYFGVRGAMYDREHHFLWVGLSSLTVLTMFLSFMMRQHYALGIQDRLIRLEMRLRYFQLTQQRFEPYEEKLNFGQIAALRFASDDELQPLIKLAVEQSLTPKAIKKMINNWTGDYMRV